MLIFIVLLYFLYIKIMYWQLKKKLIKPNFILDVVMVFYYLYIGYGI